MSEAALTKRTFTMFEPINTDHNCKPDKKKRKNRWRVSILKTVLKAASLTYSLFRLISKLLQSAGEHLS